MTAPRRTAARPSASADLRQRILDTSEALLESDGVAALSLREVARRAGVTHQAPYHHFADRESILAELAARGFDEMSQRLSRANSRAGGAGRHAALVDAGMAYVGFAIEHPGIFRIMFRADVCDPSRFAATLAAADRAHQQLERMVRIAHDGQQGDVLAGVYWSQVHGLACLIVDGPLGQAAPGQRERKALARQTLACFADFMMREAPPSA